MFFFFLLLLKIGLSIFILKKKKVSDLILRKWFLFTNIKNKIWSKNIFDY